MLIKFWRPENLIWFDINDLLNWIPNPSGGGGGLKLIKIVIKVLNEIDKAINKIRKG